MKLLSLNIWGGRVFEPLIEFLKSNSEEIDIFCFQEVFSTDSKDINIITDEYRSDIFSEIENILPGHKGYFDSTITGYDFDGPVEYPLSTGLAIFLRKNLEFEKTGDFVVAEIQEGMNRLNERQPYNMQYLEFKKGDDAFAVFNIHGLWVPEGKNDNPRRIQQSENILKAIEGLKSKKILCGDFNLRLETESIKILEKNMRNLIKEYSITDTRGSLCLYPERFADYTFVSNDVNVINFSLPDAKASDHLPMILEFN